MKKSPFILCTLSVLSAFTTLHSNAEDALLEEVLVTAQRRAESLNEVPISVSALSADQLANAGVKGILELQSMVPALRLDQTGSFVQPTIRGVGSAVLGPGISSNVAIYIDGFYQPSQVGNLFEFSNISQVQVLKGPQGALFGRNATGGAIIVNTLDPAFEQVVKIKGSYASFNDQTLEVYASNSLSDKLAGDISLYTRKSDGDIKNAVTGGHDAKKEFDSYRIKFLHDTTDRINLKLALNHSESADARGVVVQALGGNSAGRNVPGAVVVTEDSPQRTAHDLPAKSDVDTRSVYFTANVDFDQFSLTSYSGFRDEDVSVQNDLDASSATLFGTIWAGYQTTRSQEVSIQSTNDGKLDWIAGLYYINDDSAIPDFRLEVAPNTTFRYISTFSAVESYSVFFNTTYNIVERLFLTAGLRYAYEESNYKFIDAGNQKSRAKEDWENISPRIAVRYEITDSINVYGSYSEGFKSGVFNSGSYDTTPVEPETISAYEIGMKAKQASWRFDIAAFYYDYSELQVASYDFNAGIQTIRNAAEAEIYGIDTQFEVQLSSSILLRSGLSYVDAEYQSFPGSISFVPKANGQGNDVVFFDAEGNKMLRAPEITANVGAEYRKMLDFGLLEVNANIYHSGKVYFTTDNRYSEDGFTTMDLAVAFAPGEGRFKFTLFSNNITDEYYARNVSASNNQTGISPGLPRTIGASIEYNL